ncbi:ChaN family lipoprotein [Thiorhodococcus minor]|uniref:PDZ domain-containing protein n=1 Tax=Thiorhodococcus minor TaxID=57489 RepID=A0A6M0K2R1_9GAMM|nr:ChaN family lipoprotein [Thiorhodococcus minor]NEV63601.1 PDZ domain-containing protein [Thiorhodococcus minor]
MLSLLLPGAHATLAADSVASAVDGNRTRVLDATDLTGMDALIRKLMDRRVVFVGEQHDRYEDHLNQLAIIEGLHAGGKSLAIGLEFFQQPFQQDVDDYIEGKIDEADFLRRTQYFDRWRFDYRLYRPILRFAREHGIPVIALNLEAELTRKVGDVGIDGLSEAERARIPAQMDRGDPAYRDRIEAVFRHHPADYQRNFEHFFEVQLLWDEGMAERAAAYLAESPDRTLVVLSGGGHVEYGQGIPKRLMRRQRVPMAIILNGQGREPDGAVADFFLYPPEVELPPSGLMGVMLSTDEDGEGIRIDGFAEESGAKAAGLQTGDRIVRIGRHRIAGYADVRIAMIDAQPKDLVSVEVIREHMLGSDEHKTFEVRLR